MSNNRQVKLLLTGSTGFLGSALSQCLINDSKYKLVVAVRHELSKSIVDCESIVVGNLDATTDWKQAVSSVDVVIHTAARAHIMNDSVADPLTEFRKVNTAGTLTLAHQAVEAGVKRFIFISSIKANGEETYSESFSKEEGVRRFTEEDVFIPIDPYSLSKQEAEQGLLKLAEETGIEVVIIRPPLVYGPGVKANFASMMKWIQKGIPLPFGSIHNLRSLVALDNLVSFIIHCINHPKAANEVFLISDGEDISTTELLQKVAKAFGKSVTLLSVPVGFMINVAKILGKDDLANRLFGSLQVDNSKARDLLGWKPVITMEEQLKKTANAYLNEKASQHE